MTRDSLLLGAKDSGGRLAHQNQGKSFNWCLGAPEREH